MVIVLTFISAFQVKGIGFYTKSATSICYRYMEEVSNYEISLASFHGSN